MCTADQAYRIAEELGATNKTVRTVYGADHGYFTWATGDRFLSEVVASIEGTDDSNFEMMTLEEMA